MSPHSHLDMRITFDLALIGVFVLIDLIILILVFLTESVSTLSGALFRQITRLMSLPPNKECG